MELVPSALHVTLTALDFSGSLFSRTALVPVRENNDPEKSRASCVNEIFLLLEIPWWRIRHCVWLGSLSRRLSKQMFILCQRIRSWNSKVFKVTHWSLVSAWLKYLGFFRRGVCTPSAANNTTSSEKKSRSSKTKAVSRGKPSRKVLIKQRA